MASIQPSAEQQFDPVDLRGQQDAALCVVLLQQVLQDFGLGCNDLGAPWKDVQVALVETACVEAVNEPFINHHQALRRCLERDVARMHVRAVGRSAMADLFKGKEGGHPSVSVTFVDGSLIINGVSDADLDAPHVARIIDALIQDFRSNPRKLGGLDFVKSS